MGRALSRNNSLQPQIEYGVRWQSAATTPLSETGPGSQSGVALRFPPHSKSCGCGASRAVFICVHLWLSSAWTRLSGMTIKEGADQPGNADRQQSKDPVVPAEDIVFAGDKRSYFEA